MNVRNVNGRPCRANKGLLESANQWSAVGNRGPFFHGNCTTLPTYPYRGCCPEKGKETCTTREKIGNHETLWGRADKGLSRQCRASYTHSQLRDRPYQIRWTLQEERTKQDAAEMLLAKCDHLIKEWCCSMVLCAVIWYRISLFKNARFTQLVLVPVRLGTDWCDELWYLQWFKGGAGEGVEGWDGFREVRRGIRPKAMRTESPPAPGGEPYHHR